MKTASSWRKGFVVCLTLLALGVLVRAEDLTIAKGSSSRIAVDGVKRIIVANPTIIDARPSEDGRSVMVNALTAGSSELRIERIAGPDVVYKVSVRADLQDLLAQIKDLLSDVEGLEIKIVGDKIVLKGNIVTKSGYERVAQVVGAYTGVILNMAKLDRTEMNKFVEQAILRDIGSDSVTVRINEDTAILEGVVYSEADLTRAVEMAKLRMPNVKNLLRVQEVMIETDVQFLQVSTDASTDIGMNVLDNASAVGGVTGGSGQPKWMFGAAGAAKLNAMVGNGTAKVVAQPHLSTKSGGEGSFQSGGEAYFQISGNVGGNLEKVDYGIILKVKPTLQGRDRIMNEVSVEVSVPSAKAVGAFSLDKYETKSTAMCKTGESIILSGLVQTLANRFKDKTPLLGDIPLLNLFFSHSTSTATKNELVVMISPRPVFPTAASNEPYSKDREHLLHEQNTPPAPAKP